MQEEEKEVSECSSMVHIVRRAERAFVGGREESQIVLPRWLRLFLSIGLLRTTTSTFPASLGWCRPIRPPDDCAKVPLQQKRCSHNCYAVVDRRPSLRAPSFPARSSATALFHPPSSPPLELLSLMLPMVLTIGQWQQPRWKESKHRRP